MLPDKIQCHLLRQRCQPKELHLSPPAFLMITEAAALDDEGTNPERAAGMANMAKYVAVEAAIEA